MVTHKTTDMSVEEAEKVAEAVRNSIYPPTNPAMMLNAARQLYLNGAPQHKIIEILAWCLYVMVHAVPSESTPDQKMEIVALHFARKLPE